MQVAQIFMNRPDGILFFENEIIQLPVYQGMSLQEYNKISNQIIFRLVQMNGELAKLTNKSS